MSKKLYYKIRAFEKGKSRPIKFNCHAENPLMAFEQFAIVMLVAGTKLDRFTVQAT